MKARRPQTPPDEAAAASLRAGKSLPRLSIRWTLFTLFALFAIIGGAASIFVGYTISSDAVIGEAQRRVELDLRSAWVHYGNARSRLQSVVSFVAGDVDARDIIEGAVDSLDEVRLHYEALRKRYQLDVLSFVDRHGRVILRTRFPYNAGDTVYPGPALSRALQAQSVAGTVLVPAEVLQREGQYLREQAYMELQPTPMAALTPRTVETDGMMLTAAEPVRSASGAFLGFVYGGILLNRNYVIPDGIRDTVYADDAYEGKPLGTVTIFQGDLRIATNVMNENGTRAIGTRVSKVVRDRVIENGESFYDRAFVVNDWYLSAYDPIRDPDGKVIGILYVGILEQKFLDYKNRAINSFVGITGVGVAFALIFALAFAVWFSRPIRHLTDVASEMSQGNYRARVREGPVLFHAIGKLNRVFNEMADSIVARGNELFGANRELSQSNAELTKLNHAYMDMLAFVTHELKSPLASVLFALSSLKEGYFGELTEEQARVVDSVEKNVEYLNEMILNYLNLSRIEKDELRLQPERIAVVDTVVRPIMDQVARQAEAAGMRISCEIPVSVELQADADLLKIVYDNLLSNAVKYGRRGTTIRLGYGGVESGTHRFNVYNEGAGIAPEDIGKMFQKFSRLKVAELRAKKGTGLGLFITKDIIERHGGRIWVESEKGHHANFIFTLPS